MKFKLIKKYPDCFLEVNEVLDFKDNSELEFFTPGTTYWFTVEECEKYPEFWEKIVEKDYEILEFDLHGIDTIILEKDSTMNKYPYQSKFNGSFSLDYALCNYKISKIKRLSDNVEFSIGDKVEWNWCDGSKFFTIKGFELGNKSNPDKIAVNLEYECGTYTYVFQNLVTDTKCNFRHYKEPLFTTEDGVDIYSKHEKVAWVYNSPKGWEFTYMLEVCPSNQELLKAKSDAYKVFSTKEVAQAWCLKENEVALLDSKVLSYNDVFKVLDEIVYVCGSEKGFNRFFNNTSLEIKLKELVKSKQ